MPSQTASGNPFMVDSDPLASVAVNMEALATALSPRAVSVSRAAVLSVPNAAFTNIPFTAEETDLYGQATLAGGVYTVSISASGLYLVTVTGGFAGGGGNARAVRALVNGVQVVSQQVGASAGNMVLSASGLVAISAGQSLTAEAYQNSGAALNSFAGFTLSAARIQKLA